MTDWITCNHDRDDKLPTEDGHYWVWIMGDSEIDDCGGMLYEYGDYVVLMSITSEYDGPDNPRYVNGTADHDEDWDLVCAWWPEKVTIPEMK
jgi:hypothetical protein